MVVLERLCYLPSWCKFVCRAFLAFPSCIQHYVELEGKVSPDCNAGEDGYSYRRSECHRYCLNLDAEELEQVDLFLAELSCGKSAFLV